jgi:hypothetical protein
MQEGSLGDDNADGTSRKTAVKQGNKSRFQTIEKAIENHAYFQTLERPAF